MQIFIGVTARTGSAKWNACFLQLMSHREDEPLHVVNHAVIEVGACDTIRAPGSARDVSNVLISLTTRRISSIPSCGYIGSERISHAAFSETGKLPFE